MHVERDGGGGRGGREREEGREWREEYADASHG
jgi:hypothetical protein